MEQIRGEKTELFTDQLMFHTDENLSKNIYNIFIERNILSVTAK